MCHIQHFWPIQWGPRSPKFLKYLLKQIEFNIFLEKTLILSNGRQCCWLKVPYYANIYFTNVSISESFFFFLLVICFCSRVQYGKYQKMRSTNCWCNCTSSTVKCLLKSCCCHLVAGVKGVSGHAPSQLHLRVGPGDDIPAEVAAARCQAVDVPGRQHVWPHVQIRHLAHKRLSSIKTTS